MRKYTTAIILVLASVLFTFLETYRPDPDEAQFWEFAARFALITGLLKAFLIREDQEYAHQLERMGDKLDILCEDHGRFQEVLTTEHEEDMEQVKHDLEAIKISLGQLVNK